MNCRKNLIAVVALGMLMSVGMLMSCGERSDRSEDEQGMDVITIDSILRVQAQQDIQKALAYVDSLEKSNQMSRCLIYYYRANVYHTRMRRAISEMYFKKALEGKALQKESPELFYKASDYLATSLSNRGEHAEALAIVSRCYEVSRKDDTSRGRRWTAVMLHGMGYFQMQLGMKSDAEKNFSMAYMVLSQMIQTDSCYENKRVCARVSYNILDAYMTTKQYDKAWEWLNLAEDAAENLSADPQCTEQDRANNVGGVAIHKASMMLKKGDAAAAEQSYRKAYETGYLNSPFGIMEQAAFLREAGRWNELVDLIPKADSVAKVWNVPMSLYYLQEYMAPQFNTYLKSGRTEQALEMAKKMAESVDSVTSYEQNRKMKEIAVITDQKDLQVAAAEQKAALAYRWVKVLCAVLAALVLCIIAYGVYSIIHKKKNETENN